MTELQNDQNTTVLALVGPPAAGKSTIVGMLRDLDVPCKDTGAAVREEAARRYDGTENPDEEYVWNVASLLREEYGPEGPTAVTEDWIQETLHDGAPVLCLSSLRHQAEVTWLREHVGSTLVVRVDADSHARSERYIRDRLDPGEDRQSVSRERVYELREELYEREHREGPYPDHDVSIRNEDSVGMYEIMRRLENLVEVLE